jgi:serine/threonine protein kinase
MSDLTGSTISDRYRFDIRLGEGTFAQVYRVHDIRRNVDLAAKVLRADVAHEPTFLERFRREGEVLARLQHPNIVRYYDLVETDMAVFILMDYVPGETLQVRLYNISRPMTVREVFALLKPLTAALHFAHGEGVIHRDLKPANILLHENGNLLVSDFGIARLLDDATFAGPGAWHTVVYGPRTDYQWRDFGGDGRIFGGRDSISDALRHSSFRWKTSCCSG